MGSLYVKFHDDISSMLPNSKDLKILQISIDNYKNNLSHNCYTFSNSLRSHNYNMHTIKCLYEITTWNLDDGQ